MKFVKLLDEKRIDVKYFDLKTNKQRPYYQNGSRYASCPFCGSVVNIKGGEENKNQNKQKKMYASHLNSAIMGFKLRGYESCPFYKGNKGNWQGVYAVNESDENQDLKAYIKKKTKPLAEELGSLTGISFISGGSANSLFHSIVESFIEADGLKRKCWHPETVARIILTRAKPVRFGGIRYPTMRLKKRFKEIDSYLAV